MRFLLRPALVSGSLVVELRFAQLLDVHDSPSLSQLVHDPGRLSHRTFLALQVLQAEGLWLEVPVREA